MRSATDGSPRGNGIVYDNPDRTFDEVKIVHAGDQGIVLASHSQPDVRADTLTFLGPDGTLRQTHRIANLNAILSRYWTGAHPPNFQVVDDLLIAFPLGAGPMAFRMSTGEQAWALGVDVQQAAGVLAHDGSLYFPYGLEDTLAPYDVQTGAPVDGTEALRSPGSMTFPRLSDWRRSPVLSRWATASSRSTTTRLPSVSGYSNQRPERGCPRPGLDAGVVTDQREMD